jgi:hypothetical protein
VRTRSRRIRAQKEQRAVIRLNKPLPGDELIDRDSDAATVDGESGTRHSAIRRTSSPWRRMAPSYTYDPTSNSGSFPPDSQIPCP